MLTGDTPYVASKRQATKSTLLDEITMANRPSIAPIDRGRAPRPVDHVRRDRLAARTVGVAGDRQGRAAR